MPDSTPSDYHLSYLRERWERDRSSRVFLQLAEEYRRRGLHAEALEVLQVGLSHHPGYLAAQVSLGRCWLEAGQPEAAGKVLTGVLSQDPTQAVASRLLIEVWLRLRDAERARAAIDRCELLGVPPQEIQAYRQRLAELLVQEGPAVPAAQHAAVGERREAAGEPQPASPAPPAPAPAPAPAPEVAAPAAPAAEAGSPPPALPTAAAPAAAPASRPEAAPAAPGEVFRLPPMSAPPLELPARPAIRRLLRVVGGDPFQLPAPVAVAPAAGAVFALGLAAAAAPAPPPSLPLEARRPPAQEAPAERAPAAEPAPAVRAAEEAPPPVPAFAPVAEEPLAPSAVEAPLPQAAPPATAEPPPPAVAAPAVEEPVVAPAAAEQAGVPWWRAAATAAPAQPPVEAGPAAGAPPAPAAEVASAEVEAPPAEEVPPPFAPAPPTPAAAPPAADSGVELQPSGALPAPELRPSDPGTATLGELYLRQGHLGEAQKIFHQVLERDPDNEVSLRGLEAIARRRTAALSAPDLLGGEPEVKGLTSRKILLLQKYLQQIRASAARQTESGKHVPGAAE